VSAGVHETAGALETVTFERSRDALIRCTSQHEHGEEHGDDLDRPPQTQQKRIHEAA
jgi:hypothetical protein